MFETSRQRSGFPWGLALAGVLIVGGIGAVVAFKPEPPPPPEPRPPAFSWDAVGRKLHGEAAVVKCFDERTRSPDDDPDQIVTVTFGGDIPGVGWEPHAVTVEAGAQTGLERCLMKTLARVDVLERGARKPLGWRVKLATWDRHPLLVSAPGDPR